jgi:hypothetical protein
LAASVGAPATPGTTPGTATDRGNIDWSGRIGLAPLQADGRLKLRALPVHLAMPYAGKPLQVSLRHADLSLDSQIKARSSPAGWQVATDGDLQLNDVMVHGTAVADDSGHQLLSWQSLSLQGLALALGPPARPRIEVREQALTDFYSRLVLNERGHLNLEELGARPPAPDPAASAAAAAAAPAPAVAASAPPPDPIPIDLVLGPTQLRNGRIAFSDCYIKPNYSARMTELNGMFGAFRLGTREMAALTLRGRVADTALLEISGQLNPTARPLALDIRARATDLELAPLSPYAGKYAGHAIERGKLSCARRHRRVRPPSPPHPPPHRAPARPHCRRCRPTTAHGCSSGCTNRPRCPTSRATPSACWATCRPPRHRAVRWRTCGRHPPITLDAGTP